MADDVIDGQIKTQLVERMRSWLATGVSPDEVHTRAAQLGDALRQRLTADAADKRAKLIASNQRLSQVTGQHWDDKTKGWAANEAPRAPKGPALHEELINGMGTLAGDQVDTLTFGGYRKARDWLLSGGGDPRLAQATGAPLRQIRNAEADMHGLTAKNPGIPLLGEDLPVGQWAADNAKSTASMIPVGAGKVMGMAGERAAALAKSPAGKAVLGGAGAALTQSLGEQTVAGQGFDPTRTAVDTVTGGGGGLTLHGVARGADAVLDSAGALARRVIERNGGKVGVFTSGKGGAFDTRLAGLKPNDHDIGATSRESAVNVLRNLEGKYYSDIGQPHHRWRAAIAESAEGNVLRDATPIYNDLVQLRKSWRLTPPERQQIDAVLKRMDENVGDHDGRIGVYLTETDLNDARGMLGDLSGRGDPNSPSVAQSKLDKVTQSTKEMVDQGPYAKTNRRYAQGTKRYEEARNLLGLSSKPSSSIEGARYEAPEGGAREQEVTKLGNMLLREGQATGTAGVRGGNRLDLFRERYPEYYAQELDMPRMLEGKGDLSFKLLPSAKGGLMGQIKATNKEVPLLTALAAEGAGKGHGGAAAAAGIAHLLHTNADAINGRLLYAPAKSIAEQLRLSPDIQKHLIASNPVVRAYFTQKVADMVRAMRMKAAEQGGNDASPQP